MKPSKKKAKKKKKKPEPSPAPATPAPPAVAADSSAEPCSPSETLTLAVAAAAAAASETESSGSSGEASTMSAYMASSSGTASTSSFSFFSSSASTASSSAAGDERRDLAWLLDAFATATIDQVESAYREAGGDVFVAAGILSCTQDAQPAQPTPKPPPPPDLSPRDGSAGRKACKRPKKVVCAASGMVADVIGKDYTRPAPSPVSVTNEWKGRGGLSASNEWKGGGAEGDGGGSADRKYNVEEAEQFLCSMLGDNSELGMGVVRNVLGTSGFGRDPPLFKVFSEDWLFG